MRCAGQFALAAATVIALSGSIARLPVATSAQAQQAAPGADESPFSNFNGRPVSEIRFEGLDRESPQLVRNQLRTETGRPFDASVVESDLRRLHRLGRFSLVNVNVASKEGGSVAVIYRFEEAPVIQDVQVYGNTQLGDEEIASVVNLRAGVPVDEFQLGRARRAIEELYRQRGYYLVDVSIDNEELEDSGVVLFRVREGDRVRVTAIRFNGNDAFTNAKLRSQVSTKVRGILEKGPLDNETIQSDIQSIIEFYRNFGYLDVRADREITISPDGREAIVTFIIDEGPLYTLRDIEVVNDGGANEQLRFSEEQVRGLMSVKTGDVYAMVEVRRSLRAIRDAYYRLGYVEARVSPQEIRDVETPRVDLRINIDEGERFRTGEVVIQGNSITRQNVIRREVRVTPDEPLDRVALDETRRRLISTRLFRQPDRTSPQPGVEVTIQPERPEAPGYRDVLIEIEETNTGAINFGAAVSSDANVVGSVSIQQRNFDISDTPDSLGALASGRAFRGGGQEFSLTASPGIEVQTYSVSLTEPALFDTDYSATIGAFLRDRIFSDHDEQRLGTRLRFGRRFGDRWTAGVTTRVERVELSDIDSDAPVDLFEDSGPNTLLGVGVEAVRTTVPPAERLFPTRGARTELGVEQVFGDFSFTKLRADHQVWLALYEDFLGRRSVLSLNVGARWNLQQGEAPLYERYFHGGRSFRGFDFRGVSPRGIRNDTGEQGRDPVGGDWSFFAGAEFLQPIWGEADLGRALVSGVAFIDTGTVIEDPGFDDYRVSVGFGVRLLLPISPAPLAFDFGFPIVKESGDRTRLFSFSVDLPF